jgi:hypothetical protein
MDSRGRKFTSVILRGVLGFMASSFAILSYFISSVELFAFSHFISGIVRQWTFMLRQLLFFRMYRLKW